MFDEVGFVGIAGLDRVWSYETALLGVQIGRREPDIDKEFKSCGDEIRNALAFRSLYDGPSVLSGLCPPRVPLP